MNNCNDATGMRKRPQIQFKEMIKTYGNIIAVKIGQRWMIVLNQIDVVREALLKKPVEFAGRPDLLSSKSGIRCKKINPTCG